MNDLSQLLCPHLCSTLPLIHVDHFSTLSLLSPCTLHRCQTSFLVLNHLPTSESGGWTVLTPWDSRSKPGTHLWLWAHLWWVAGTHLWLWNLNEAIIGKLKVVVSLVHAQISFCLHHDSRLVHYNTGVVAELPGSLCAPGWGVIWFVCPDEAAPLSTGFTL